MQSLMALPTVNTPHRVSVWKRTMMVAAPTPRRQSGAQMMVRPKELVRVGGQRGSDLPQCLGSWGPAYCTELAKRDAP